MKEILHVQIGNYSNYLGSHYWNTQESYLNSEDDILIDPSVLFRENELDGAISYTPRLLAFDYKSNFGPFARSNILSASPQLGAPIDTDSSVPWHGGQVNIFQPQVRESSYLSQLDRGGSQRPGVVKYWSDFNRLYHSASTFQPLPDKSEWKSSILNWQESQHMYSRFDQDNDLVDTTLRRSLEECSSPQGLYTFLDSVDFGAFAAQFLTALRDEAPKMAVMSVPMLAACPTEWETSAKLAEALNDSILLRTLRDIATLTIPILPPHSWPKLQGIDQDVNQDLYKSSAVIASHLESVSLPTRLRKDRVHLADQLQHLTYGTSSTTRFSHLVGGYPLSTENQTVPFEGLHDFSSFDPFSHDGQLSRCDTLRGFGQMELYERWSGSCAVQWPIVRYTLPSVPLPTSFPDVIRRPSLNIGEPAAAPSSPTSTSLFSSLTTTTAVSKTFEQQARACDHILKTRTDIHASFGVDTDDLRELAHELWTMHDTSSPSDL